MKVAWTRMTVVVARSTLESGSIDFCRKNPDRIFCLFAFNGWHIREEEKESIINIIFFLKGHVVL